jgi:hypothetical protein
LSSNDGAYECKFPLVYNECAGANAPDYCFEPEARRKNPDTNEYPTTPFYAGFNCLPPCPHEIFDADEWNTQLICYVIPGIGCFFVSLFICVTIAAGHMQKAKIITKDVPDLPKAMAVIGLLWSLIDIWPSVLLGNSLYCVNEPSYLGRGGSSPMCQLHKCTVFLSMALNYLLMTWLVETCLKIVLEKRLHNPGFPRALSRSLRAGSILVPLVCMVLAYSFEATVEDSGQRVEDGYMLPCDQADTLDPLVKCGRCLQYEEEDPTINCDGYYYPNHHINQVRNAFTCQPLLIDAGWDWAIINIHFIIGSVVEVVCVYLLLKKVVNTAMSVAHKGTSFRTRVFESFTKMGQFTFKLTAFASFTSLVLVINIAYIVVTASIIDTFGNEQDSYAHCSLLRDDCTPPDVRPDPSLEALSYFCKSLVPFQIMILLSRNQAFFKFWGLDKKLKNTSSSKNTSSRKSSKVSDASSIASSVASSVASSTAN